MKALSNSTVHRVRAIMLTDEGSRYLNFEYSYVKLIGKGTFGNVYRAITTDGNKVAIKTVCAELSSEELHILKETNYHPNIVKLKYYFMKNSGTRQLCLVMEFLPFNLSELIYRLKLFQIPCDKKVPFATKLYSFQMLRGIGFLHAKHIAHRDIKPSNILCDPYKGILKIADLGSATHMLASTSHTTYICTRYYRAPELLLGCTQYSVKIDCWSAGCVLAEILKGSPLFRGQTTDNQLLKINQILGNFTDNDLKAMNCENKSRSLRKVNEPITLQNVLPYQTSSSAIEICQSLLHYEPGKRSDALVSLLHPFFHELHNISLNQHDILKGLPDLFNFNDEELNSVKASVREELLRLENNAKALKENSVYYNANESCQ